MPEWDAVQNYISSIGYFTIYSPTYDDELEDYVSSFDYKNMDLYLDSLQSAYEQSLANVMEAGDEEEYDLIGLNSNSFTSDKNHHNIFMEWDREHGLPDLGALRAFGGTIVETDGGYHLLKEANIPWEELAALHQQWGCCPGFSSYSNRRKHACLRICPKGENRIRIIQREDSFLYSVYEKVVKRLEEVHDGVVG